MYMSERKCKSFAVKSLQNDFLKGKINIYMYQEVRHYSFQFIINLKILNFLFTYLDFLFLAIFLSVPLGFSRTFCKFASCMTATTFGTNSFFITNNDTMEKLPSFLCRNSIWEIVFRCIMLPWINQTSNTLQSNFVFGLNLHPPISVTPHLHILHNHH